MCSAGPRRGGLRVHSFRFIRWSIRYIRNQWISGFFRFHFSMLSNLSITLGKTEVWSAGPRRGALRVHSFRFIRYSIRYIGNQCISGFFRFQFFDVFEVFHNMNKNRRVLRRSPPGCPKASLLPFHPLLNSLHHKSMHFRIFPFSFFDVFEFLP